MTKHTYISCPDTAKLIRKTLKQNFPGVKFSVRSSVYSMGASIRVGWTDGPRQIAVQCIVGKFAGAHYGADFVFCDRTEETA